MVKSKTLAASAILLASGLAMPAMAGDLQIIRLQPQHAAPTQHAPIQRPQAQSQSDVTMSVENGVRVFRVASPIDVEKAQYFANAEARADAAYELQRRQLMEQRRANRLAEEQIELQEEQLERLARIEKNTKNNRRRSRRGRYRGNPPFFGPNGFEGNSNFTRNPVRNTSKGITYRRRIFD